MEKENSYFAIFAMLHEFLRRFLPNQFNHNRDDFSFELLRTASVKELKKYGDSGQRLIRPFNVHQHSRDNSSNLVSLSFRNNTSPSLIHKKSFDFFNYSTIMDFCYHLKKLLVIIVLFLLSNVIVAWIIAIEISQGKTYLNKLLIELIILKSKIFCPLFVHYLNFVYQTEAVYFLKCRILNFLFW